MNSRQFWRLLLLVAVVVGLSVVVRMAREKNRAGTATGVGERLFPELPVNEVTAIRLRGSGGVLDLRRQESGWCVAQREDYPADFGQVQALVRDLAELKAVQVVAAGPSLYHRLGLNSPGQGAEGSTGIEVRLAAAGDRELAVIVLGQELRPERDDAMSPFGLGGFAIGRYVRVPATGRVCLVSKTFGAAAGGPAAWLDKEFVKLANLQTAELSEGGKGTWRLSRSAPSEDLTLAEPPTEAELDTDKIREVGNALAWVTFADVAGRAGSPPPDDLQNPRVYRARDFDGLEYELQIGRIRQDGNYPVTVDVRYVGAAARTASADEKPDERATRDGEFEEARKRNQQRAVEWAGRLRGWVFLIDRQTLDRVLIAKDAFRKPPPPPAPVPAGPAAEESAPTLPGE